MTRKVKRFRRIHAGVLLDKLLQGPGRAGERQGGAPQRRALLRAMVSRAQRTGSTTMRKRPELPGKRSNGKNMEGFCGAEYSPASWRKGGPMTRIIERRQYAAPGEEVLELRVFQLRGGDVRGCVVSADVIIDLDKMADLSAPVAQAYLDALALCETENVETLWVHDPHWLFPPRRRPDRRGRLG
jgi:hypothetical protein